MSASVFHAAQLADPFGATVCGATEGWRTQVASDISCDECLRLLGEGQEDTHLAMWEVEQS